MDEKELKDLLNNPKRILNIARVFHQMLHAYDKMEEEEQKKPQKGIQNTQIADKLEVTCKDKDGNVKAHVSS